MKNRRVWKIRSILDSGSTLSEAEVGYLMMLIRKLIEDHYSTNKNNFLLLRLICNWALHTTISNSNFAQDILRSINSVLSGYDFHKKDREKFFRLNTQLSEAISFTTLRNELGNFLDSFKIRRDLVDRDENWKNYLDVLADVIDEAPLQLSPPNTSSVQRFSIPRRFYPLKNIYVSSLILHKEIIPYVSKGSIDIEDRKIICIKLVMNNRSVISIESVVLGVSNPEDLYELQFSC